MTDILPTTLLYMYPANKQGFMIFVTIQRDVLFFINTSFQRGVERYPMFLPTVLTVCLMEEPENR